MCFKRPRKSSTKRRNIDILKLEESMCKISFEKIEEKWNKKRNRTGFFYEINKIKNNLFIFGLFINYQVLDEYNLIKRKYK